MVNDQSGGACWRGARAVRAICRSWFWVQLVLCLCFVVSLLKGSPVFETETGLLRDVLWSTPAVVLVFAGVLCLYENFWRHSRRRRVIYFFVALLGAPLTCFAVLYVYYWFYAVPPASELEAMGSLMVLLGLPALLWFVLVAAPLVVGAANRLTRALFGVRREMRLAFAAGAAALAVSMLLSFREAWCVPQSRRCEALKMAVNAAGDCAAIADAAGRLSCWQHLAEIASVPEHCERIPRDLGEEELLNTKDWCYSQLARTRRDDALCIKVQYPASRILCETYANLGQRTAMPMTE